MAATILLLLLGLLGLGVVFVVTLLIKGWKTALIVTAAALVVFAGVYMAFLAVVSSSM